MRESRSPVQDHTEETGNIYDIPTMWHKQRCHQSVAHNHIIRGPKYILNINLFASIAKIKK